VSALSALTVPADVDLLYIVDDPAGMPTGKKITVGNLLARSYASMYVSAEAATTIVTPGTYVKAAGATTELTLNDFDMPVSNRLRYIGSGTILCVVEATVSMKAGANNQESAWRFAKNGVTIEHSQVDRKVGIGADIGALTVIGEVTLANGDYVELWVTNETSTASVTWYQGFMNVRPVKLV
jgi:hypothetical protein